MYELIIIWETGEKETYTYSTYKDAQQGASNFKNAFGSQVSWTGIDKK